MHSDSLKTYTEYTAVALCILLFTIWHTPSPINFLSDPDGGVFLLGAMHLIKLGEMPYVDYFFSYGPLLSVLESLGLMLFQGRLIGSIFVITTGYALGYFLYFHNVKSITNSRSISFALLLTALLLFPRYYKYFVLVVPMLAISSMNYYFSSSKKIGAILLGASVGIGILFRHDHGAFVLIPSLIVILTGSPSKRRFNQMLLFSIGVLIPLFPWVVFLLVNDALISYFTDIIRASFTHSSGLSLPHPLIHWSNLKISIAYLASFILPVISLISTFVIWNRIENKEKVFGIALSTLAILEFIQSSHRADLHHLLQGLLAALVCLALSWHNITLTGLRKKTFAKILITAPVITLLICNQSKTEYYIPFNRISFNQIVSNLQATALSKDDFLVKTERYIPKHPAIRLVNVIRKLTKPDQRVAVLPNCPQVLYFADRLAGGRILGLSAGYFDGFDYQEQIISALKRQKVSIILWNENYCFDGLPQRNPVRTHEKVYKYVLSKYNKCETIKGYSLYVCQIDNK